MSFVGDMITGSVVGAAELVSVVWVEVGMVMLAALTYYTCLGRFFSKRFLSPRPRPQKGTKLKAKVDGCTISHDGPPSAARSLEPSKQMRIRGPAPASQLADSRQGQALVSFEQLLAGTDIDDWRTCRTTNVPTNAAQAPPPPGLSPMFPPKLLKPHGPLMPVKPSKDFTQLAKEVRLLGKSGDLVGAMRLYEKLVDEGHGQSSLVLNSALDACVESGGLDRAVVIFRQAVTQGVANVVSFNTVMKGYLAERKLVDAEKLLVELNQRGMSATQASYHGLLQAYFQNKNESKAWSLIRAMKERGVSPNGVTCTIMLKGLVPKSAADMRPVLDLVDAMDDIMDAVLFSLIVESCLRVKRLDWLTQQRANFMKQSVKSSLTAPVYGAMIQAYGVARDLDRVWDLWNEMMSYNVRLTSVTIGCMVESLVANRCADDAWELVRDLWKNDKNRSMVNTVVYATIIKGFVILKQPMKVMQLYAEMQANGIEPNAIVFNTILNAFAQCDAMERVPELLNDMRTAGIEPDIISFSTICKGFCTTGHLDRGLELLKVMKMEGKTAPDEVMYNSLMDACAKERRVEDTIWLFDDMRESGVAPSNYTLSILVKLLGWCRRLDQAFSLVESVSQEYGFKPNLQVYTCMIQACFNNRRPQSAINLYDRVVQEGTVLDEKAYTAVIRGCMYSANGKNGMIDKAFEITMQAYDNFCSLDPRFSDELVVKLGGLESARGQELMRKRPTASRTSNLRPPARGQRRF